MRPPVLVGLGQSEMTVTARNRRDTPASDPATEYLENAGLDLHQLGVSR